MTAPADGLLLVACGVGGGLVGIRLRLPIGGLLGAIIGAGSYHLLTGATMEFGPGLRLFTQGIVGMLVGASVSRHVLTTLRSILLRTIAFSLMVAASGVLLGWVVMSGLGHVDLLTGFLSAAPAGAMEMGAAALATFADAEVVLATHILRILSIGVLGGTFLPLLARRHDHRHPERGDVGGGEADGLV